MKKVIHAEGAPEPVGPYGQALQVGKFLFVSGQVAIDPKEGRIITSDIREQTVRVMENIKMILHAAVYRLSNIVQSNVYLSSMKLFSEFNDEYAKYFFDVFPYPCHGWNRTDGWSSLRNLCGSLQRVTIKSNELR
jgi:2-iminobutanoate/2-iminopropanoate deaminase